MTIAIQLHPDGLAPQPRAATRARRSRALLAALFTSALLAGCGGPAGRPGVTHLDPRLEDGRSSSAELASIRHVVASFDLEGAAAAAWQPRLVPFEDRACRGWEWSAAADEPLAAAEVDGFAWRARLPRSTRARLSWRRSDDPPDSWPAACTAEISVDADPEGRAWGALGLGGHPSWSGDITALRFEPDGILGIEAELTEIELSRRGYWGGFEPLEEQEGLDGGLVVLDGYARRTWPSDFGVPLFVEAEVPKDGRLVFDLALAPQHRTALERIHFAIDLAEPGTAGLVGDGWERLWYRTVVPAMTPPETLWRTHVVDLDEHAGERVRLRLRSWSGHGKDDVTRGLDGALAEAAVFWGTPELLGDQGDAPLPNILLVTLDTTRGDVLDPDADLARTPFLDELAAGGIRFSAAYSASNATQPSHASILTGSWPIDHGVHDNYALLVDANRTLPERLRLRGYHTVGAVSQRYIGAGCGFGQGFDEFLQASPGASLDGGETIVGLRKRIEDFAELAPERPLFLWLHLFDPHTPYAAPQGYVDSHAERFGAAPPKLLAPGAPGSLPAIDVLPAEMAFLEGTNSLARVRHDYGVAVSYADGLVENLASSMASGGLLGRTAFFVTADHGEALGERQSYFNHQGLFEEVVRVPLVMRIPGGPAGVVVDEPASGVDLAATILSYVDGGVGVLDDDLRGRDLLAGLVTPATEGGEPPTVFFEHASRRQVGLRSGDWHFITTLSPDMRLGIEVATLPDGRRVPRELPVAAGTHQLFDLAADPGMGRDLAAERPELVERFLAELADWEAGALDLAAGAEARRETTAAERAELEKLGY